MTQTRRIQPIGRIVGTARPPGSKSLTNRALLVAALTDGHSRISGALASDDTRFMVSALRDLGLEVAESDDGTTLDIHGQGAFPARSASLYVGNAGTAMRFLTAALSANTGEYAIDGDERMRQRPIADLVEALNELDVSVTAENGCPPVRISSQGLEGGRCSVPGTTSSQYISAILMAAPLARNDVELAIRGDLVSAPYVDMTLDVMEHFGVSVPRDDRTVYRVTAGTAYHAADYAVEPDASAASYFFGAAAITGGTVRVNGLGSRSVQGDMAFISLLEKMGCTIHQGADWTEVTGGSLRGIQADMRDISDTAMTLAVVALFAEGLTHISGISNVRVKESDRIAAVATEARKMGAEVEELPDGMVIHPRPLHGTTISTYNDHRIAMSFAIAGLRVPDVIISDPGCVSKTFPDFFGNLWGA